MRQFHFPIAMLMLVICNFRAVVGIGTLIWMWIPLTILGLVTTKLKPVSFGNIKIIYLMIIIITTRIGNIQNTVSLPTALLPQGLVSMTQ